MALNHKLLDKTHHNSSVTSQTSESAYGTKPDNKNITDISLTSDGEISIEQLQKQQEELQKMQEMIQQKMSCLQTAIVARASRDDKKLKPVSRTALNTTNTFEDVPNERPPAPERMEDMSLTISDYTSQPVAHSATHSVAQAHPEKYNEEDSVPLDSVKRAGSSLNKSRRSRKDRYNEKSQERIHQGSFYRKSAKKSFNNTSKGISNLRSGSKKAAQPKIHTKPRSTMCSKVRPVRVCNNFTLEVPKSNQVEKATGLINKRTLNALKRIRPIQSSLRVIREFVRVLKFYNPKLGYLKEDETWMKLSFSLTNNSANILKDIKLLSVKCTSYSQMPKILEEFNEKVLGKKDRNVPSCSSTFQKECQPFIRVLQSLINYYKTKERVSGEKSDHSRSRSNCGSMVKPRHVHNSAYKSTHP